ncbi:uncharacterized protein LOC144036087 isoform X2 [Vanacampus margaritifer]
MEIEVGHQNGQTSSRCLPPQAFTSRGHHSHSGIGKGDCLNLCSGINSSSHVLIGLLTYAEALACIGSQKRSPFDTRGCLSVSVQPVPRWAHPLPSSARTGETQRDDCGSHRDSRQPVAIFQRSAAAVRGLTGRNNDHAVKPLFS